MADKHDPYEAEDTGHVWDENIRELENPPPRWWMICLHLSWITVVIYLVLYPSIPLLRESTKGVLGWTQIKHLNAQVAEIEKIRKPFNDKIEMMSIDDLLKDSELLGFAQASARALFGDNCAPCHGAGGQGGPGFPILADDDWLYGGSLEAIMETITDGREGSMPAHGEILSQKEIDDVVAFVVGLSSGKDHEGGRAVFAGQTEGEASCMMCHSEDAKGNPEMGGPNLTDGIWRFDGSEAGIRRTIINGVNEEGALTRKAMMPEFGEKLSKIQIKKLALLVHQFGGGK